MDKANMAEHIDQLLVAAIEETKRTSTLRSLHRELKQAHDRLHQPMRLAIVGLIKAGKSTLMNALLGESLVPTGTIEATFNVNWLKYGPHASLLVHFKDGSSPEKKSLADLERLTRRSAEYRDYLLRIKYIEVFYPNALLQTLNLIDTPGLASFYKDDSQGTIDFLNLHGQELTKRTREETSHADAILYLFSHSIAASSTETVTAFQGPMMGQANPINSIGVMTRLDGFWSVYDALDDNRRVNDVLEAGREIIARLQNDHPHLRRLFYSIVPVCGLLGWGAQTLTDEEFHALVELTKLSEERLQGLLSDAGRFSRKVYPDVAVSPERRNAVLDRLGQYGIWRASRILRSGVQDRAQLVEVLLQQSGLPELKQLFLSHFGNRAYLIKLASALNQIKNACFLAIHRDDIQGSDRDIVKRIDGTFGQLADNEAGFKELKVLRDYYQEKLPFSPPEVQQLLQITGEFGTSDRQRLGLPERKGELSKADIQEILQISQECAKHWHRRAINPGASREVIYAARVLVDAYNYIYYKYSNIIHDEQLEKGV